MTAVSHEWAPKPDPVWPELVIAACSCGWQCAGSESEQSARRAWESHKTWDWAKPAPPKHVNTHWLEWQASDFEVGAKPVQESLFAKPDAVGTADMFADAS